jgi:hypothetical protein
MKPGVCAVRFTIVVTGCAAALALAACGGSTATNLPKSKPSASPTRSATPSGAVGQITRLGGGLLVVRSLSASATFAYSASTNVLQTGNATQSNVLAGACVVVAGQRDSSGAVTADMVQVQFNMNGNCTPPLGVVQASPSQGGNAVNLRGKITNVSGTSFVVQPVTAGGAPVTVNMPSTAVITRLDTASISRLAVGQCVRVNGQPNAAGVVQARAVVITPAGPSGCALGAPGGGALPQPSGSASPGR